MWKTHNQMKDHQYKIGEWVLVKRQNLREKLPERGRWMGPAQIIMIKNNSIIVRYISNGFVRRVPMAHTKRFHQQDEDHSHLYTGPDRRTKMDYLRGLEQHNVDSDEEQDEELENEKDEKNSTDEESFHGWPTQEPPNTPPTLREEEPRQSQNTPPTIEEEEPRKTNQEEVKGVLETLDVLFETNKTDDSDTESTMSNTSGTSTDDDMKPEIKTKKVSSWRKRKELEESDSEDEGKKVSFQE